MTVLSLRVLLPGVLIAAGIAGAVELPSKAPSALHGISDCIRANAPGRAIRQSMTLTTINAADERHRTDLFGEWKRDARGLLTVSLRVTAPADMEGMGFSIVEQQGRSTELFRSVPNRAGRERIPARSAKDPLFGSDWSFEDFRRTQNVARARNSKLLADTEIEGRVAWQIETTPAPEDGSAYSRIVSAVDKVRCVPLQVEFYTAREEPSKLLLVPAAKVERHGDGWVPRERTMKDLYVNKRSVLVVESVELDPTTGSRGPGPLQ